MESARVKFVFSKKATKIDEIFTVDLKFTKVQLISEWIFGVFKSPKKPTNFLQISALNSFIGQKSVKKLVCFWGDLKTPKIHSEINWPLDNSKINYLRNKFIKSSLHNLPTHNITTLLDHYYYYYYFFKNILQRVNTLKTYFYDNKKIYKYKIVKKLPEYYHLIAQLLLHKLPFHWINKTEKPFSSNYKDI